MEHWGRLYTYSGLKMGLEIWFLHMLTVSQWLRFIKENNTYALFYRAGEKNANANFCSHSFSHVTTQSFVHQATGLWPRMLWFLWVEGQASRDYTFFVHSTDNRCRTSILRTVILFKLLETANAPDEYLGGLWKILYTQRMLRHTLHLS